MQELHQGGTDLFGAATALELLEGVPLTVVDLQTPVQRLGQLEGVLGPDRRGGGWFGRNHRQNWTETPTLAHPDAMRSFRPSQSSQPPVRWLPRPRPMRWTHLFARLFSLAERARRPDLGGASVANRRLQQRLAMAQRLMEVLPASLTPGTALADRFWVVLRWGGLGLLIARLLS